MIYFPFHVGDWITGTKLMSSIEKGVYIDLLTYYYSVERPITEDECKRIARAYAGAEQDAMQYVLQNHFAYVDGAYVHKKCEEIISQTLKKQADISEKKRKAARARWNKAKQGIQPDQENALVDSHAYAGAEQMQYTCNVDAMLTNNHKPNISTNVDKKKNKKEKSQPLEKPEDVTDTTWADFSLLRNKLKAPLTQTALNAIRKEAEKAGISLEDALKTCCMRGWRGFKSDWIRPKNGTGYVRQTTTPALEDFMREDYWANEPEEMIP